MPVYLRALVFTIFVPGTVGGLVPYLIGRSQVERIVLGGSAYDSVGYMLFAVGASIYLWCAYDFTFIGRGTPAIFDPPKHLVVRGLYYNLRNPMYFGILIAIGGQAIVYGASWVVVYAVCLGTMFHLFVMFYEEPHLHETFGEDYIRYCRQVNRWLPTFHSKKAAE